MLKNIVILKSRYRRGDPPSAHGWNVQTLDCTLFSLIVLGCLHPLHSALPAPQEAVMGLCIGLPCFVAISIVTMCLSFVVSSIYSVDPSRSPHKRVPVAARLEAYKLRLQLSSVMAWLSAAKTLRVCWEKERPPPHPPLPAVRYDSLGLHNVMLVLCLSVRPSDVCLHDFCKKALSKFDVTWGVWFGYYVLVVRSFNLFPSSRSFYKI